MKRIITSIAAILVLTISAFAQESVTKTFQFSNFESVSAESIHVVYLTEGNSDEIEVTYPEEYEKYLDYSVANGTLYLKLKHIDKARRIFKNLSRKDEIIVKVQMKEIRNISLSGAAKLVPEGNFTASGDGIFKFTLSGASSTEKEALNISGDKILIEASGASNGSVKGKFNEAIGEVSGASSFYLEFDTKELDIEASGASNYNLNGKAESIDIECSGASSVEIKGVTKEIDIQCSGASKVDAEEMIAENARATASGASHISVYGDNDLNLQTSGASTIKYYGKAKSLQIFNKSISRGN